MKFIISVLPILFFSAGATANYQIHGTIEDVMCGEVDPFAIGDACIVFTTDIVTGDKYGLHYRDYDWSERFVPSDEDAGDSVGDSFIANQCSNMTSREGIAVLREIKKDYFYLDCQVDGFKYTSGSQNDLAMREIAQATRSDSFFASHLPLGFSAKTLPSSPEFTPEFKTTLSNLEAASMREWQNYVRQSDEFDYLSEEQRERVKNDPKTELEVPYLNQISAFHEIYKDGVHVGYVVELDRHVRAAIIQDGSGLVLYLDLNQNVLAVTDWDS